MTMNDYVTQHRSGIDNRFYVYLHRRASDDSIFYVGKGCGSRAWNTHGRNNYWNNIISKHGFYVDIVFDCLSEEEALRCEVDTILELRYFGIKLANFTSGGDSPVFTEESKKKMSDSRKGVVKTREWINKIIEANRGKKRPNSSGLLNPTSDKNIYTFENISGELFIGTRIELCEKFNLNSLLLRGLFLTKPRKSSQGWRLKNGNK